MEIKNQITKEEAVKKTISTAILSTETPSYLPIVAHFEKVSYNQFKEDVTKILFKNGYTKEDEEHIKVMYDKITLPQRATDGSAGYDFVTPIGYETQKEDILIPTGIRCKIANGWGLFLMPRSGMGFKFASRLANTIGLIDSDYYTAENEGHIMVKITPHIFHNKLVINSGDKICQGVFLPYGITSNDEVHQFKRTGGFGSTGK